MGNRAGHKFFDKVCLGLSKLSDGEVEVAANHYHFEEGLDSSTVDSSIPMLVTLNLKL